MGKDVNKKFTVSLDISTEEAEKQVKASAENIKKILQNAMKDGINIKELRSMAETINSLFTGIGKNAPLDIEKHFKGNGNAAKRVQILTDALNDLSNALGNVSGKGAGLSGSNFSKIIKDKVKEFYDAQIDGADLDKLNSIKQSLKEALSLDDSDFGDITSIFKQLEIGDIEEDQAVNSIKSIVENLKSVKQELKTNVENNGVVNGFKNITQEAKKTEDATKKVMYHLGNLFGGGKKSDTFGDMPYNLTEAALDSAYEQYGFGVLGGGLFGVSDPNTIADRKVKGTNFIQSIDLSKYNMYMANTEERAASLMDFLSKLQKFAMKTAEPNYTGFDDQLQGLDVNSLYQQFQTVFTETDLTKDKFNEFINQMVDLLKQAGLKFDEDEGYLDFTSLGDLGSTENISTRFMKMLGYQGVNVGGTSFDGFGQGSVLFDFNESDIVGYFNTVESAIKDYENIVGQVDGKEWIGTSEQLEQYGHNIDEIIARVKEYINMMTQGNWSQEAIQGANQLVARLEQVRTNIDSIKSDTGLSDSQFADITSSDKDVVSSKSAATEFEKIGDAVQEAENKVNAFLALAEKIQSESLYGSAENNVEIGKYTERLEVAKAELDELGAQGLITADQLEEVNRAFEESKSHLEVSTSYYDGWHSGGSSYDYYDEYQAEKDKKDQLQFENEALREQLDAQKDSTSNIALYEDADGQLALFDGLSASAERATVEVQELEDAVKRVDNLDGQMNLFDDDAQAVQEQKVNDALQEQVNLEKQIANADQPRDTGDLQVIQQENDALREQKQLEDSIDSSKETGTKKTKSKTTPEQKWDTKLTTDALTKYQGELRSAVKKLDFNLLDTNLTSQQQEIVDSYKDIVVQIEKTIKAVKNGEQVELSSIQETVTALREKIQVYKEQNNVAESGSKKTSTSGIAKYQNVVTTIEAKQNNLQSLISKDSNLAGSSVIQSKLKDYEDALTRLKGLYEQFKKSKPEDADIIDFKTASTECNSLHKELEKLVKTYQKLHGDATVDIPLGDDFVNNIKNRKQALQDYVELMYGSRAKVGDFKNDYHDLLFTINNGDGTFTEAKVSIDNLGTSIIETAGDTKKAKSAFESFADEVKGKFKSLASYFTAMFGIQEVFQILRQGVQYVKEIDSALTELKKVTNETDAAYDSFLQTASKTASTIGSTVSDFVNATADFARLGYNISEASNLAKAASVYKNVGDGIEDISQASESIISTMKAFGIEANNSMSIVDRFNEVGNSFAISSTGIGEAMQRSASALFEAGNTIDESIALITGANSVVQNPEQVGTALKTLALRLRGAKVELEEAGLEADNMAESTSTLQAKLLALTHGKVDIMLDENTFKNTTQILREMAEAWEYMTDIERSSALELMGGKRQANILASLIKNFETVEQVIETSANSAGSALAENEKYLDSIQGKLDLFTSALQTFWMNFIDSNAVKAVVDLGTFLIKMLDTVHGKIIAVVGALMLYRKFKDGVKFSDMFKGAVETLSAVISGTKSLTAATLEETLATKLNNKELAKDIITKVGLVGVTGNLTKEQIKKTAATLSDAFANKELTASQYLAAMSTMGLKTALQGLWKVLISNPVLLVAAAVAAAALAFDHFHTTVQEAADAAKEAFDEIQSVVDSTKSTIQSLESELSTLQSKIDEFDGRKLSFAEDQELEKLKNQREELEHSLKVQEQLLELQRESSNKQAIASMKAYTKAASEGADETQETAKTWGTIGGVVAGIAAAAGIIAAIPTGGLSLGATVAGVGALGAAGGIAGNKIGEAAGSKAAENEGTYDSWYETYTKALETSREEEQKALEKYQKDSSNIKKLDKWQEAQQKTSDIETEMYEHLSQMQQYYNDLEYGMSDEIDEELDTWYNFLDKFSIDQGASGAEVTALDRIFGENASEELQTLKEQILDTVNSGKEFDFSSAISESQELNSILEYIGLSAEDVKNYFTQIGEAVSSAATSSEKINPVDTYSAITESVSQYNDIIEKTKEIIGDNTQVTQEYKDSIIALIGSEEEVNKYFDESNGLIVKNAKGLNNLISQNVKLAKSQHQLDYYNLVRQLNDTLNGTKKLDGATRDSIYTLLDQIDVVDRAIYQYQLLEDSLLGAQNAFNEFEQAKEIDSKNTYGDSYVEMVQTMYDSLYKTGQVGTEQFRTAVEHLIPDEVYQGIKEDSDRMKAIYDYYNKNILPSLRLKEDQFSMDSASIENFVGKALKKGVFEGDKKDFDLVEGMNLEKAAKLMQMTKTQAYAFFAELDKYNTSLNEQSFLSQLDDSLEGRITNATNKMEELNRQKLALLEDGGYEKNKEKIDAINKQLAQCDKNLKATGVEAYNMWQEYSKNDVALTALSAIEDKQQEITKEGATTLGLEWDEVKGKTIQQVYDEILTKQQELGVPTDLVIQFAQEHIETELDNLEEKLKAKKIDVEANVVWNESEKQYEVKEDSEFYDDKDLQKYVNLSNEGYALDGYLENGLTTTETYLSNIESILKSIYDLQSGNDTDKDNTETKESKADTVTTENKSKSGISDDVAQSVIDNFANNPDSMFTVEQYEALASFFTDTIPEVASDVGETLKKFFTETVPQEWNEFWEGVGKSFDEFGSEVEKVYNIAKNFFTETIPTAWNEFWAGVGEKLNEIKNDATELYEVVSKFFKETIPQKWEEFWNGVDDFLTEDVPYAIGYAAGVVAKFFTVTIPEKWDEFWEEVEDFIDDAVDKAEALCDAVEKFITETIPEKWDEFWKEVSDFYEEVIAPVVEDVKNAISTFFNETLPTKWNEFWNSIGQFFTETIPNAVEGAKNAVITFFTVTIPEKWNEFWDSVGQFISENIAPALSLLYDKLSTFFTVTVPENWNGFWEAVGTFFTQTIPAALQALGNKIIEFFTVTIPTKWTEFWGFVDQAFVTPIQQGLETIKTGITNFFTVTLPGKINSIWSSITSWISSKASSIWENLTSGFTAGFGGGGSGANGTAHAHGTAYKDGSWGAPKTETSLVGELGPEILVRNGRWTTVGDHGAEFTQVKKGDIIFNHRQTEHLLKNGYVTGRGKAYASGTAYSGLWNPTSPNKPQSNKPGKDFSDVGNRLFDASDSLSSAAGDISSSASDAADEFREVFDWIEVRLEEINEDINLRSAQLENKIGYKNQNKTVDQIIELNQKLYDNLIAGANKYYAYAEKLLSKVPTEYREAAQDGTIAIEEFVGEADEKTLEAIQEYREWVQKGDEAAQQAQETLTEISNLAKQAIDNISQNYDNKNSLRENKKDQLEAYNDLIETTEGFESENIYKQLIKENNKIISNLQTQRDKMQAELNKRVESGEIKKYSQDWYDAVNDIAAVDTEIIELKTDTENYQDAINELHWEKFDALIGRIEAVSKEVENLIDILSNEDMVDESGNWTDEGITTLGLYAQQMEAAEVQAKKYQEEIDYLNENWQELGYTEEEYIEKLGDLKDGQYDAIQAYHDSKDAIVDLNKERVEAIKDGIQKEIDAYEELIEKKKEELDAEKDLYDFQKSIMEQEKDVADLQRQLAALSGDNSASARAKRAQLEAELAEAEANLQDSYYERSVQNQQDALDKELENFNEEKDAEMEGWDEYLENTNQVVSDSLATVQANTETVYNTLQALGEEYGLSITESLTSPWEEGSNAIQSFSEQFGISMSATVDELTELELQFKETMLEIEQAGKDAVNAVKENAQGYTEAEYQEPKEDEPKDKDDKKKKEEKVIKIGGKINAKGAKIYDYAGDKSGANQYYAKDPIYVVLDEQSGYLKVRHHKSKSGVTGWFKKSDVKAYAKGTSGVDEDQLALIDEIGDELLVRVQNGRLTYLEKGSGVVPADLTENLMGWGRLDPSIMLDQNRPAVGVHPEIHNTQIQIDNSIAELIHIDHCDQNTLPDVKKIVDEALEKHTQKLNNSLRKYTR